MKSKPAAIEWLLIPAPDLPKARAFYSKVFHFEISDYSRTFSVFKAANISGGFDSDLEPSEKSLSFSITVDDIDQTLNKIVQNGGTVVKEKYSLGPGNGYCARFSDPNGNILELYSNK